MAKEFKVGDLVQYNSGKYHYYVIVQVFESNGLRYNLRNNYGMPCGYNIMGHELTLIK